MRQRRLFLLWLLTILFCLGAAATETHPDERRRDVPQSSTIGKPDQTVAVLSDARQLARTCNARPQRLVPSPQGGAKQNPSHARFRNVKPSIFVLCDRKCRLESAPFASSAACDYYVFALRHLLL